MGVMTPFRCLLLLLPLLLCCSCVTRTSAWVFRYAENDDVADMAALYAGKGTLYRDGAEQYVELPRYRVRSIRPVFGTIDDHPRITSREPRGTALYRIAGQHFSRPYTNEKGRLYYTWEQGIPPRLDRPGTEKLRLHLCRVGEAEAAAVKARAKRCSLRQQNIEGSCVDSERTPYAPVVYAAGIPLLLGVDVPLTIVENICLLPLVPVIALWPDPEEG